VKRFGLNNVVDLRGRGPRGSAGPGAAEPPETAPAGPTASEAPAPPPLAGPGRRARRIVAFGGGKGGIGKSLVAANIGIALARSGQRVLLVDADLGGANLHTCLGVAQPGATLSDFVLRGIPLAQLAVPTGIERLSLVSGALDSLDAANPRAQVRARLLAELKTQEVDYLLLDLGAGTSVHTLDFFLLADHGVLVLLPEPTSVENAYRFLKASLFRRLQQLAQELGVARLAEGALGSRESAMRTPADVVAHVRSTDATAADALAAALQTYRVKLVVNQVRAPADESVGPAVASAWKKFFGLDMDYLGGIPYDDAAWRAVRRRRPLLLDGPDSAAARQLTLVAGRLATLDAQVAPG
jgi:flagellar biosynthesis protein FlhG